MIKYFEAPDIEQMARKIVEKLNWNHINLNEVGFLRSRGSGSRGTIARCHALGKAMQMAMKRKGFYLIEVISERFDKMPEEERIKVIIHELMHIPKTFGGGFIHHHMVNERTVNKIYQEYKRREVDFTEEYKRVEPEEFKKPEVHSREENRNLGGRFRWF